MAQFDLVVRGGLIADGGGGEPKTGDVAITDGRIIAVGEVLGGGREEIDAKDRLVTPGFVDIHTHYDGHVTWEERLVPSKDHGVTTAVLGNCGVGFAPCRAADRDNLLRLMAGVEDIPELVMVEGIPWDWESFPEYLDAIGGRARDADIVTQIPHSALRVYAMGQRAVDREPARDEDIALMARLAAEAVAAGAVGFATSRAIHQRSSDGHSIPTVNAEERELQGIAAAVAQRGGAVLQMLSDFRGGVEPEFGLMRRLVEQSGCPLSFTLHQRPSDPHGWRRLLELTAQANAEGLPIRGQVIGRPSGVLFGLALSMHPLMHCPSYQPIAGLPLAERIRALHDPELRARLIAEDPLEGYVSDRTVDPRRMVRQFDRFYVLGDPPDYEPPPATSIGARARALGVPAAELAYDALLADGGNGILFNPAQDYEFGDLEVCRTLMQHPNTVLGLGDAGAHCGILCDASYPTFMLAYWTRDRTRGPKLDLGWTVKALTSDCAETVGLLDRGRIAPGYRADLNVIDYERLTLHPPKAVYDLPAGGRRLTQRATGYDATIVAGEVTYREGAPTGALPGRLVRGRRAAPVAVP